MAALPGRSRNNWSNVYESGQITGRILDAVGILEHRGFTGEERANRRFGGRVPMRPERFHRDRTRNRCPRRMRCRSERRCLQSRPGAVLAIR